MIEVIFLLSTIGEFSMLKKQIAWTVKTQNMSRLFKIIWAYYCWEKGISPYHTTLQLGFKQRMGNIDKRKGMFSSFLKYCDES